MSTEYKLSYTGAQIDQILKKAEEINVPTDEYINSLIDSKVQNVDEVYVLAEGETIEDVPEDVKMVIDPNGGNNLDNYVQSVNGVAPDENGNVEINIPTDDHINGLIEDKMGEGEWERIETITVEENTTSVLLNTTQSGEHYALEAVIVKLIKPASTPSYTLQCYTQHYNSTVNMRLVLGFGSESAMGARFEVYPQYGFYMGSGYLPNTAYSNSGTALAISNDAIAKIPKSSYITGVRLIAYSTGIISKGTTIEVLGVRANV